MHSKLLVIMLALIAGILSCKKNIQQTMGQDVPVIINAGNTTFPPPNIPFDNPLTVDKIKLGRMLFYEKELSSDGTINCASCHMQQNGFSDESQFSVGVNGATGNRQGMAIFNLVYHTSGFFWDGRAAQLRDQALGPIQNPLEMNETLENVVAKLQQNNDYLNQFELAFGDETITSERIALALENFMFTIVSNDAKYDRVLAGNDQFTASEERGRRLFFGQNNPGGPGGPPPPGNGGQSCVRCHGGPNFDNNQFFNIGLDPAGGIVDIGREGVTGNPNDRGKFRTVSLRNIAVTAPYMHDGRFASLNDVLDHYDNGIQNSPTLDPGLGNGGFNLNQQDKTDLINFLGTLTDNTYLNNSAYGPP